jgi:hypothetical protein
VSEDEDKEKAVTNEKKNEWICFTQGRSDWLPFMKIKGNGAERRSRADRPSFPCVVLSTPTVCIRNFCAVRRKQFMTMAPVVESSNGGGRMTGVHEGRLNGSPKRSPSARLSPALLRTANQELWIFHLSLVPAFIPLADVCCPSKPGGQGTARLVSGNRYARTLRSQLPSPLCQHPPRTNTPVQH